VLIVAALLFSKSFNDVSSPSTTMWNHLGFRLHVVMFIFQQDLQKRSPHVHFNDIVTRDLMYVTDPLPDASQDLKMTFVRYFNDVVTRASKSSCAIFTRRQRTRDLYTSWQ